MIFLFLATAFGFGFSGVPKAGGCAPHKTFSINCQSSIGVEGAQSNKYRLTVNNGVNDISSNEVSILNHKVSFFVPEVCKNCTMTLSNEIETSCVFVDILERFCPKNLQKVDMKPPKLEDKNPVKITVRIRRKDFREY